MKKHLQKRYIIPILILLLLVIKSCVTLRKSDSSIIKNFKKKGQTTEINYKIFQGNKIRYITDKKMDKNLPTIIFVHGAPGSSTDYYKYLQDIDLQKQANLISVDRLGYGYSNFGKAEVSITKQAAMIHFIAQKYNSNKIILVGWSYGGPIISKMAMDDNQYAHIFLIAPAISPNDEKYFWIGNFAKWKATRWLSPKVFQVAEDEKLAHAAELRIIEKDWDKITTPITYYHGNADNLVPYENMAYIKSKVKDSLLNCVTIKNGSHFIIFKNYDRIKKDLLDVMEEIK